MPTRITKPANPGKTTATKPPGPLPHSPLAREPLPLPGLSMRARLFIVLAVLLGGLAIAVAVVAIVRSKPAPDPLAASQAAVEDAMQNLRASNWRNLQGATRDDLERRILLLDSAIYATDSFSSAVSKLDRQDPENARVFARRDVFNARAKVLRRGRNWAVFLRDHFGHWIFDPVVKQVLWNQSTLRDQFAVLETELDDGMARLKAASQPVLPPGPPVRTDLLDSATEPQPQPAPQRELAPFPQ